MARLRTTRRAGEIRIVFAGRLTADDMGRLEHACAEALTHDPVRLHLDLVRVTELDGTARALVESLQRRGAIVVRGRAAENTQRQADALATHSDTIRGN
jgi:predicted ThiF/HesA family dinucleotide-utilizing enzyme